MRMLITIRVASCGMVARHGCLTIDICEADVLQRLLWPVICFWRRHAAALSTHRRGSRSFVPGWQTKCSTSGTAITYDAPEYSLRPPAPENNDDYETEVKCVQLPLTLQSSRL